MKKRLTAILSLLVGATVGGAICARAVGKLFGEVAERAQNMSDKHLELFLMMNQWVKVKQQGKNLATYFQQKGYKQIAIYGMSYAGETLLNELKDSEVDVVYGIDKNVDGLYVNIDVVSPDEELRSVDAIVVTPIFFMDEIEEVLSKKVKCPIICLDEILYEV